MGWVGTAAVVAFYGLLMVVLLVAPCTAASVIAAGILLLHWPAADVVLVFGLLVVGVAADVRVWANRFQLPQGGPT